MTQYCDLCVLSVGLLDLSICSVTANDSWYANKINEIDSLKAELFFSHMCSIEKLLKYLQGEIEIPLDGIQRYSGLCIS